MERLSPKNLEISSEEIKKQNDGEDQGWEFLKKKME
jgi:hypothetical protein